MSSSGQGPRIPGSRTDTHLLNECRSRWAASPLSPSLGGDGQAWPQDPSWVTMCGAPSDPGPSSETAAAVTAFLVCFPRRAPAFQPTSQPGDVSNSSLASTVERKYLKRLVVVLKAPAIMPLQVQGFCVHLHLVSFLFFLLAVLGLPCCTGFFFSCGEQGLLSTCNGRACHCGGFSCCTIPVLGHTLKSCGFGLSCSTACGIFPDQESNLCFLHWQTDSLPLSQHRGPFWVFLSSEIKQSFNWKPSIT